MVQDFWQGRGSAPLLLREVIGAAQSRGIRRFRARTSSRTTTGCSGFSARASRSSPGVRGRRRGAVVQAGRRWRTTSMTAAELRALGSPARGRLGPSALSRGLRGEYRHPGRDGRAAACRTSTLAAPRSAPVSTTSKLFLQVSHVNSYVGIGSLPWEASFGPAAGFAVTPGGRDRPRRLELLAHHTVNDGVTFGALNRSGRGRSSSRRGWRVARMEVPPPAIDEVGGGDETA